MTDSNMATKANYFKIGVFVLATTAILTAGIIALSSGFLTRETLLFETYIDESVQGLSVGSSVLHRGVQIGTVKQITFLPMGYTEEMPYGSPGYDKYNRYVLVIMAVDRSNFPPLATDETIASITKGWVRNGLRLKLSYQGITGISYIEADYVDPTSIPDDEIEVTWKPANIYIPASPSLFKNLTESVNSILQELNTIDFAGIAKSLTTTLATVDTAVKGAEIPALREDVMGLIGDLRETNRLVVGMMDKSKSEDGVNIPETIAQVNTTLKRLDKFLTTQQSEVEDILVNIRRTAENLREFTENLKKYPASIIAGPPAPPRVLK